MNEHPFIPKSNSKIVPPFIPKPKESLEAENARLIAENARLRKAGDEVVSRIQVCTEDLWCSIHRWNAATEGEQS